LPVCPLSYDGECELELVIDIHGNKIPAHVIIDTGFTSGAGFGLKLPLDFLKYATHTGTADVQLIDGTIRAVESIADAKIIQIEGHQLEPVVTIPALFMGGMPVVGVMLLQLCVLNLDGPCKAATIKF
jgi:predicted aspartyl protease